MQHESVNFSNKKSCFFIVLVEKSSWCRSTRKHSHLWWGPQSGRVSKLLSSVNGHWIDIADSICMFLVFNYIINMYFCDQYFRRRFVRTAPLLICPRQIWQQPLKSWIDWVKNYLKWPKLKKLPWLKWQIPVQCQVY